jgi:hypothetical protein
MNELGNASRLVAADLRRAEGSINNAIRDTAQFLISTLDVTDTFKLPAAVAQRTVKSAIASLTALAEGQEQMAMRAHISIERAGRHLGLDETSWGESIPKPAIEAGEPAPARA